MSTKKENGIPASVFSKFCKKSSEIMTGSQIEEMTHGGSGKVEGHVVEVNPVENQKFKASFNLKCTDGHSS